MTFTVHLSAIAVVSVLLFGTPMAGAAAESRESGPASATGIHATSGTHDARPFHACRTPTTTTIAVTPSTGPAYRAVTITVKVTGAEDARGATRGAVTILDGDSLLARNVLLVAGSATATTNALGPGSHSITAEFTRTARAARSASGPAVATFDGAATSADGTVAVTIPPGSLTITSTAPAAPALPVPNDAGSGRDRTSKPSSIRLGLADAVITDTRAGNLGFTASVVAGPIVDGSGRQYSSSHAGLVHLDAGQVPGNALRARDVRVRDARPGAPGLGVPRAFARYPAGLSTGTVRVQGDLVVAGLPARARVEWLRTALTFTVM